MSSSMPASGSTPPLTTAHLRIARPTRSISALLPFYVDGLGFQVLGSFPDAGDGFTGIMLGMPGCSYHLEFTECAHHDPGRAPTEDNLLVFYLPVGEEYGRMVERMKGAGFGIVKSFNPYWDANGVTFEDPDGYRVVLANMTTPVGG